MILGKTIRLRAIERDDLKLLVTWLNDPDVCRNLSLYLPLSINQEEAWYENMLKGSADEFPLMIEVMDEERWIAIGEMSLMNIDWRVRQAEVGIFLGEKRFWNRGYGQRAMSLMLKHAFQNLTLNRVYLRVNETNPRAIHVYEKVGFVHEGKMRQAGIVDGQHIDLFYMSVLRSEWQNVEL